MSANHQLQAIVSDVLELDVESLKESVASLTYPGFNCLRFVLAVAEWSEPRPSCP